MFTCYYITQNNLTSLYHDCFVIYRFFEKLKDNDIEDLYSKPMENVSRKPIKKNRKKTSFGQIKNEYKQQTKSSFQICRVVGCSPFVIIAHFVDYTLRNLYFKLIFLTFALNDLPRLGVINITFVDSQTALVLFSVSVEFCAQSAYYCVENDSKRSYYMHL